MKWASTENFSSLRKSICSSRQSHNYLLTMSEGIGLTLRKKGGRRPPIQQISGPIPSKAPINTGRSIAAPRDKNQQSAATSDLVKRRYSTRFNQLPDFTNAPPIPSLPSLPGAPKRWSRPRSSGRPGTSESTHPIRVDVAALKDANLQPEKCELHFWFAIAPS
jgi:exocyst complex component 8